MNPIRLPPSLKARLLAFRARCGIDSGEFALKKIGGEKLRGSSQQFDNPAEVNAVSTDVDPIHPSVGSLEGLAGGDRLPTAIVVGGDIALGRGEISPPLYNLQRGPNFRAGFLGKKAGCRNARSRVEDLEVEEHFPCPPAPPPPFTSSIRN